MASDGYCKVDSVADNTGDSIEVGILNDLVCLRINNQGASVWLDATQRDQFIKAYAEAERRAGRYMCATPDDCVNGPGEHAFVPDNDGTLPCCRQPWEEDEPDAAGARFPIYARFAYPGNGYDGDQKQAAKHLTPGDTYLISHMDVGQSRTTIYLHGFRGTGFNSVMFAAGTEAGWIATQAREEAIRDAE